MIMKQTDNVRKTWMSCWWTLLAGAVALIAGLLLSGCKSIEYVPVETTHEIHHHHTDSIHEIDSVTKEIQTVIMQLDSDAMAQYGIRLKAAERAWLVKTSELERELQRIAQLRADTVHEIDSIPFPVPVTKYVERGLSFVEKSLMAIGALSLTALLVFVVLVIKDKRRET